MTPNQKPSCLTLNFSGRHPFDLQKLGFPEALDFAKSVHDLELFD
jgi:hypothetical protein